MRGNEKPKLINRISGDSRFSQIKGMTSRCSGGHGFDSCRGLRFFFFVPRSCHRAKNSPSLFTYHANFLLVSGLRVRLTALCATYRHEEDYVRVE